MKTTIQEQEGQLVAILEGRFDTARGRAVPGVQGPR